MLYSDYLRDRALTGEGTSEKKLDFLTEAVMEALGKDTVYVTGATSAPLDTTFNMLKHIQTDKNRDSCTKTSSDSCTKTSPEPSIDDLSVMPDLNFINDCGDNFTSGLVNGISSGSTSSICNCYTSLGSMTKDELKKRKLILEIQYYEKMLKR